MFLVIKRKHIVATLAVILASAMTLTFVMSTRGVAASTVTPANEKRTVIVDAGHGGVDGGASAADGTLEKDLNLVYALYLRDILEQAGYDVVTTRETDMSIHDDGADTIRQKKVSDLKNRLAIMEGNPHAVYIGIHMNTYTDSRYSGTQVFYGRHNDKSEELAKCIQAAIIAELQQDSKREVKKAPDSIYLLSKTTIPAVIVECGFLSNEAEAEALKTDAYRDALMACILRALEQYDELEGKTAG